MSTVDTPRTILEAQAVSKSFPGVQALDNVDFRIYEGQLNALVGENGAGKSTLMNILSGVFPPDSGRILLRGNEVVFNRPKEAQEAGISVIFQELNLLPNLSVAENIFLGREPLTRLGLIDYAQMEERSRSLLERLKCPVNPRSLVSNLRIGQQQIVEIAKALSFDSKVIIMDEPTSAISESETSVLFDLIDSLKREGVAIVYITHKLEELERIGDWLTVLRDGCRVGSGRQTNYDRDSIVKMMIGRKMNQDLSAESKHRIITGEGLFKAENISVEQVNRPGHYLVENVSLSVDRGEVLGIFGLVGAGRTALLETLFGLRNESSRGDTFLEGRRVNINSPGEAIRAGIAFAPEDRKEEGLILKMTVAENTSLASLKKSERFFLLDSSLERDQVQGFIDRLRIRTPSLSTPVLNLSGGNQQKVILAKWLATSPKLLMLDEPTRGIDVGAKQEIYSLIEELTRAGLAVLLASSELPEIMRLSDRIIVMAEGRKTAEFSREDADTESIMKAALHFQAAV